MKIITFNNNKQFDYKHLFLKLRYKKTQKITKYHLRFCVTSYLGCKLLVNKTFVKTKNSQVSVLRNIKHSIRHRIARSVARPVMRNQHVLTSLKFKLSRVVLRSQQPAILYLQQTPKRHRHRLRYMKSCWLSHIYQSPQEYHRHQQH